MLKEMGLWERTILTGLRRDIDRMYSVMDVFLLTSLWEGLTRTVLQALTMNIPVVANNIDGMEDIIEHGKCGYLCEPGNLSQMADYCLEILYDSTKRKKMGKYRQKHVLEEFSEKAMIEKIENLYLKLVK